MVDEHYVAGCHGTCAEQGDEAFYDDRSDASDDLEKGRIRFPPEGKLYGREGELKRLGDAYEELALGATDDEGSSVASKAVFLAGYSGVGKSALATEFADRTRRKHRTTGRMINASGKYTEQRNSAAPFSAIAEVLEGLAGQLPEDDVEGFEVRRRLKTSELIGPKTEGERILRGTFPGLAPLWSSEAPAAANPSMNAVKECTRELLSCVFASLDLPAILFLDDLQWADEASLEMLRFLLASRELKNVVFVCAYRSNEVDEGHMFAKLMDEVTKARGAGDEPGSETVLKMELFGLSPRTIARFVADCVKAEDHEDVADLAEVIYNKTMGNIFFTKQALEELVRKNILFYDVMCFEWRWVVDKAELEDYVSDDVVESVKGKIRQLDDDVRVLLTVMAYIPNALDSSLLTSLMSFQGQKINEAEIEDLLQQSSDEGMTLRSADGGDYAIAHDRIRQASLELAAEDGEEDENGERGPTQGYDLPLHVSNVLLRRVEKDSKGPESERSLFVACDLRNRLPPGTVNAQELAKLNLRVARVAKGRGSSSRERELLRKGLKGLEEGGGRWKGGDYQVTLELYDALIVSEHSLGEFLLIKKA